jgi:hypothetical protein
VKPIAIRFTAAFRGFGQDTHFSGSVNIGLRLNLMDNRSGVPVNVTDDVGRVSNSVVTLAMQ